MKKDKDVYGQEIMEYLKKGKSFEIVERDDGYIAQSEGPENYFQDFNKWNSSEKKAISYAKGKVLDVGAGAGRVSLYLQKKGLNATAIDNSPLAIAACKKRGVKNAKVLSIENVSRLSPKRFNTIIMFGNNFGLFGSFNKAKRLLKVFHKITEPKALIIAESNNPYKTKDPNHLSYHKFNIQRRRMSGQLKIRIRFNKLIGNWFDYLFVSKEEMKKIVNGTGWKINKIIDSGKSTYIALIEKV